MIKKSNLYKIVGAVLICFYLLTYGLAFTAFRYDDITNDGWDGRMYRLKFVVVMASMGVAFTLAIITYLKSMGKEKKKCFIINIISCVFQFLFLVISMLLAKNIYALAEGTNDVIFRQHCNIVVVMSLIIIIINVISALIYVINYKIGLVDDESKVQQDIKHVKTSYMHGYVLICLMLTVCLSIFYVWGITSTFVILCIAFLLFFGIPAGILLSTIVSNWIERGAYLFAAGGYIIYGYLVHGAVYRIIRGIGVLGFSHTDTYNPFFEYALHNINAAVAVIAAIVLLAKFLREKIYTKVYKTSVDEVLVDEDKRKKIRKMRIIAIVVGVVLLVAYNIFFYTLIIWNDEDIVKIRYEAPGGEVYEITDKEIIDELIDDLDWKVFKLKDSPLGSYGSSSKLILYFKDSQITRHIYLGGDKGINRAFLFILPLRYESDEKINTDIFFESGEYLYNRHD